MTSRQLRSASLPTKRGMRADDEENTATSPASRKTGSTEASRRKRQKGSDSTESSLRASGQVHNATSTSTEPSNQQPRVKRPPTFRVRDIPLKYDQSSLQTLLTNLLHLSQENKLLVRSLTVDASKPTTQVATITFTHMPPSLSETSLKTFDIDDRSSKPPALLIDADFLGLTTLASPSKEDHAVDIIALSGLGGHAFGSFRQKGGDYMWLRDDIPTKIPNARVMIYGHDSHLHKSESTQNLHALGEAFIGNLRNIRDRSGIPMILIGHSLGGLIIKQAMILLRMSVEEDEIILNAICSVLFFGVPNRGMDIDALVPMVRKQPNELLLRTIAPHSDFMLGQCQQFDSVLENSHVRILCYYETLQSPTAKKSSSGEWAMNGPPKHLVDRISAQHWRDKIDAQPISKTHSGLVKFDPGEEPYNRVLGQLMELSDIARIPSLLSRKLGAPEIACLRSLSFLEMDSRLKGVDNATERTNEWIFAHSGFMAWQRREVELLWIKGKPGSGKSTLLKHIIKRLEEDLQRQTNHIILPFFFHGRGSKLERTPLGLFRALTNRLLSLVPDAFPELLGLYNDRTRRSGKDWQWHLQELEDVFEKALVRALKSYSIDVMVDAVDECDEKHVQLLTRTFEKLTQSMKLKGLEFRLCFTCRHFPAPTINDQAQIHIDWYNQADIETFVATELSDLGMQECINLRNEICGRAEGIFSWARLAVDRTRNLLHQGEGPTAILRKIEALSQGLATLYWDILSDFPNSDQRTTLRLMRWVLYAEHPMTLEEIFYAMAFEKSDTPGPILEPPDLAAIANLRGFTNTADNVDTELRMRRKLEFLSHGLLETQGTAASDTVQFVHQSVREFFVANPQILHQNPRTLPEYTEPLSHYLLSRACLRCIAAIDRPSSTRLFNISGTSFHLTGDCFVNYAVRKLTYHINRAQALQQMPFGSIYSLRHLESCFEQYVEKWTSLWKDDTYNFGKPGSTSPHIVPRYNLLDSIPDSLSECNAGLDSKEKYGNKFLTLFLTKFASGYGTVLIGSAAYAAVLTVYLGNLAVEAC